MSMQFRDLAAQAIADGAITENDILELRRAGWADGQIQPEEADAIFLVNDRLEEPTAEWSDFFVEAMGEFIVNTVEPKGYVSEEQADWLMGKISHNGKTDSLTELELLVRVFERAQNVPQRLRDYALEQVERAVLTGEGPTRCGGSLEKGNVTEAEARLMRRIIFSTASERPAAVSRREAELLYRIKDAVLDSVNAPDWQNLFVQGVGNYLMGFSSHTPLSRDRAAELEGFMNDHTSSIGGFFGRVGKSLAKGKFVGAVKESFGSNEEVPDLSEQVADATEVDTAEQMWLAGKLDGNGKLDVFDTALLDFLAEESGYSR